MNFLGNVHPFSLRLMTKALQTETWPAVPGLELAGPEKEAVAFPSPSPLPVTSPVGLSPILLPCHPSPGGGQGLPPGSRAGKEASSTVLLRKARPPDPEDGSCRLRWQRWKGTVLSCRHWVQARPMPQTLPLPKLLTEVSRPCFPWGLPSLHSRPVWRDWVA